MHAWIHALPVGWMAALVLGGIYAAPAALYGLVHLLGRIAGRQSIAPHCGLEGRGWTTTHARGLQPTTRARETVECA